MKQQIVIDHPPMFDRIDAVFKVKGKPVIFAWGNRIYNPQNVVIGPELLAHEGVHGHRQHQTKGGAWDWWLRYLDDPEFRLSEEAHAHWAEYHWLFTNGNRQQRKAALKLVAKKLASPMYGTDHHGLGLITPALARGLLLDLDQEYRRLKRSRA